jgi:hypothetical protein
VASQKVAALAVGADGLMACMADSIDEEFLSLFRLPPFSAALPARARHVIAAAAIDV